MEARERTGRFVILGQRLVTDGVEKRSQISAFETTFPQIGPKYTTPARSAGSHTHKYSHTVTHTHTHTHMTLLGEDELLGDVSTVVNHTTTRGKLI